eukprot:99739_1
MSSEYECFLKGPNYCCPFVQLPSCSDDSDCLIDCSEYRCYAQTIDATNARSLTLKCGYSAGSPECEFVTVKCASILCIIHCYSSSSCEGMKIHASTTNNVILNCDYFHTCQYMDMYVENASFVQLNCWYDECRSIDIHAEYAKEVVLNCSASSTEKGCRYIDLWANYSDSVTIHAQNDDGWYRGNIFASNAKNIIIICASKRRDYACVYGHWYLPSNAQNTFFYCYGTGCHHIGTIIVEQGVSLLDMKVNTCGDECNSTNCIDSFGIQCGANNITTMNNYTGLNYCSNTYCGCHELSDMIEFYDTIESECVMTRTTPNYNEKSSNPVCGAGITAIIVIVLILSVFGCCAVRFCGDRLNDVSRDVFPLLVQTVIMIASTTASFSIVDAFSCIGWEIGTDTRGKIAIATSSFDLVLVFVKLFYRYKSSGKAGALITSFKAVFVGLVDTAFDIFAGLSLINSSLFKENVSDGTLETYFIIGTLFGTSGEIIEMIIEILFSFCELFSNYATCIMAVELPLSLMELGFGIYIAQIMVVDEGVMITAITVYSILILIVCCACGCGVVCVAKRLKEKAEDNQEKIEMTTQS